MVQVRRLPEHQGRRPEYRPRRRAELCAGVAQLRRAPNQRERRARFAWMGAIEYPSRRRVGGETRARGCRMAASGRAPVPFVAGEGGIRTVDALERSLRATRPPGGAGLQARTGRAGAVQDLHPSWRRCCQRFQGAVRPASRGPAKGFSEVAQDGSFVGLRREGERRSPVARSPQSSFRSRTLSYVEERNPRAATQRASSCRAQQKDRESPGREERWRRRDGRPEAARQWRQRRRQGARRRVNVLGSRFLLLGAQ